MRSTTAHIFIMLFVVALLAGLPRHARGEVLPKKIPVTVTADTLDYDRTNDRYMAIGHVKIEQEGIRLEADKVVLDNKTGETTAEGHVFLQDKGDIMHAENMKMNINTRDGVIVDGDVFIKKDNIHVTGSRIERRAEAVYHVDKGTITSCDDKDWFLKADVLDIDMEKYATGRHLTFNVRGVPVIYTPYFLFPVRRQTGFLLPEDVGYSTRDGFFMDNAFFWAISDYKDMTIYSDYRAKVGHGTALEYRYMNSQESEGQMYYKFFDQYHTSESRWNFRFQHQEEFAEDLSGRVDINLVSDEHYFYDLDKRLEDRSRPYLDSNAFYVERWNTASLYLLGQYSTDLTQPNGKTVQKLPELRYTIYDETIAGPLHLNFDGSATNFTRQEGDGARRADFNPRLTAQFGSSGLSVAPNAGLRATFYDKSADSVEPTERKFFYAGADVNARISRVYGTDGAAGIGKVRHSIEPTISYNYIPHVEQASIPQFDSIDFVAEQNSATFTLINRLTAHYKENKESEKFSTYDMMVFRLSRSYDFTVARQHDSATHPGSDILGELYLRTPKTFSLSATGTYNPYDRFVSSHYENVIYTKKVLSLNLTHSFTKGGAEYLISKVILNLSKWDLSAQLQHDILNNRDTQQEYILHYASQCWGLTLTYTAAPGEYRYKAMVDLKGLGSRGKNKAQGG